MVSRSITHRALVALSAAGILATILGITLGMDATQRFAGASPALSPQGTLGIGDDTIAPVADVAAADKLVVTDERPASVGTPVVRKAAPIPVAKPKPKPAPAPARATAAAPAPSRGTTGGWQSAKVSWYGPGFYGRKTASGAVLTEGMMNVAHKSMAFGTKIQFEYKGRTVTAVVNDRGPYVHGRVFDLGPGTAKALGFGGVGTVKYRILGR
ncbi:MAG: septal ring lytic transglycosylase RlpA family protein [Actinomycetota bacterium]|nr:septal ring lytic transglycosylase RlpA family protein [Actinomycetota bacterium]MDZ4180997.1 septal ring lytic transglycosylase RlpA family protein [Coriobacteriia bacterium]